MFESKPNWPLNNEKNESNQVYLSSIWFGLNDYLDTN